MSTFLNSKRGQIYILVAVLGKLFVPKKKIDRDKNNEVSKYFFLSSQVLISRIVIFICILLKFSMYHMRLIHYFISQAIILVFVFVS